MADDPISTEDAASDCTCLPEVYIGPVLSVSMGNWPCYSVTDPQTPVAFTCNNTSPLPGLKTGASMYLSL